MPLLQQGMGKGTVGDPVQGLLDGGVVLGSDGMQQIVHVAVASDLFALGQLDIVRLAWRVRRGRSGIAARHGGLRLERRVLGWCRGARILLTADAEVCEGIVVSAFSSLLPFLFQALFVLQVFLELYAECAHRLQRLLPGFGSLRRRSGMRVLPIRWRIAALLARRFVAFDPAACAVGTARSR